MTTTKFARATELCQDFGVNKFDVFKCEVIHETPKGVILRVIDEDMLFTCFSYSSLCMGTVCYAGIRKIRIQDDNSLFITAVVESVIAYPEEKIFACDTSTGKAA